jgi:thioredoxin
MAVKQQFKSLADLLANASRPVLVDFYAEWCGPCKMMAKVLEEANDDLQGRVQIVKINTEKYPALASQYEITALPTMVLFENGKPVKRLEGLIGSDELVDRLRPFLR